MSIWNEEAELTGELGPQGTFWQVLVRHSPRFRERLRHFARRAQNGNPLVCELDALAGTLIVALPVHHRHHTAGSVLACGLADAFFDEETFARFCDTYALDRTVLSRLAAEQPRHQLEHLQAYASILAHHVDACSTASAARRDICDMSSHLDRTYEELHLLYQVSTGLSVSKKPVHHFRELCEELLHTTVVRSFAVILEPAKGTTESPTIVQVGPLEADTGDLLRCYQLIRERRPNAGEALVVDQTSADPELSWASTWLQQFVFYRLAKRDRLFGGILAINHVDGSEFNSYEIQFINALAERSAAFLENVQLYDDLERLFSGLVHALVSSIDAKDPYTCGHSQRVAWLSHRIAQLNGMSEMQCQRVYLSGLLHDVGKIGISEAVLCKTGRLTREEFEEIKRHPEIGARILEGVPQVAHTVPGVLHHHERMDGKGYPAGLAGYDIPLLGRIIGLADSYDAMTTNRTYRQARPLQIALAEIRRCSGTQFDPALADLFLQQNIQSMHREVTEFGNLPIGSHPAIGAGFFTGDEP